MAEVESPPIEQIVLPRPYQSEYAEATEKEIMRQKVSDKRNRLRMQFIKKRKDFHQPVKFTETDSDRNSQFQTFKDDLLGLKENKVMEIGYLQLYI